MAFYRVAFFYRRVYVYLLRSHIVKYICGRSTWAADEAALEAEPGHPQPYFKGRGPLRCGSVEVVQLRDTHPKKLPVGWKEALQLVSDLRYKPLRSLAPAILLSGGSLVYSLQWLNIPIGSGSPMTLARLPFFWTYSQFFFQEVL